MDNSTNKKISTTKKTSQKKKIFFKKNENTGNTGGFVDLASLRWHLHAWVLSPGRYPNFQHLFCQCLTCLTFPSPLLPFFSSSICITLFSNSPLCQVLIVTWNAIKSLSLIFVKTQCFNMNIKAYFRFMLISSALIAIPHNICLLRI